jgi:thymidylate kinase
MQRGRFIAIYGINNIGKSTHARLLTQRLIKEGYKAIYLKYPIYNLEPTGPKINTILRSGNKQSLSEEDLQTIFMRNRKDYEPTLRNILNEGYIVVAEDYTGTGIAWGTAKGADQKWLTELNAPLLKEDFSILLTGRRNILARENSHIHETNDQLIAKVGKVLLDLAGKYNWRIVELQEKIEDTANLIWIQIEAFLKAEKA